MLPIRTVSEVIWGHVDDATGAHPLVTSGVIDPLDDGWGRRPTRFAKRSFGAPSVLLDRVDPSIDAWIRDRLVPKVLVASQTRVIEAIVDPDHVFRIGVQWHPERTEDPAVGAAVFRDLLIAAGRPPNA